MATEEAIINLGTFNLEGVTPFGGSGPQIPHRIPVRMKIDSATFKPKEGDVIPDGNGGQMLAINGMMQGEVVEPPEYAGARRSFFLRFTATDDSDDGKKDWKRIVTTLRSGGYSEADVNVNGLPLTSDLFKGLTVHVRNEHVLKDGKRDYDQATVITPEVAAEENERIAKGQMPDQTPITVTSRKAKEAANVGGAGAGAGSGGSAGGGAGKGLAKAPASGGKGGGLGSLRSKLQANA
jgi:hypothetical protein